MRTPTVKTLITAAPHRPPNRDNSNVRLHHALHLRRWVPGTLLGLWRELHPGMPVQLQLPFVTPVVAASSVRLEGQQRKPEVPQPQLALGEKADEQPF